MKYLFNNVFFLIIDTDASLKMENGVSSKSSTSGQSIGERRHSSSTQDLNEYIYSVAEEQLDTEVAADDDDVFEMEPGGSGEGPAVPGNSTSGSGGGGASSEAKRRTQSLGSLSGEPKSPRKVLSASCMCV